MLNLLKLFEDADYSSLYKIALSLEPKDFQTLSRQSCEILAVSCAKKSDFKKAITYYQQSSSLDPTSFKTLNSLGVCQSSAGLNKDANTSFLQALKLKPFESNAEKNIRSIISEISDVKFLEDFYLSLNDITGPETQASVLDQILKFEVCEKNFRRAEELLSRFPGNHSVLKVYGYACVNLNNLQKAITAYESDTNQADAAKLFIDLAIVTKNRVDEKKLLLKALAHEPNNARALKNLALTELALENFEDGWPLFHYRLMYPEKEEQLVNKLRKEKFSECVILPEQGIGDQTRFLVLLEFLQNHFSSLKVVIDPRLIQLCERTFPRIKFTSVTEEKIFTDTENFIHMFSVAALTWDNFFKSDQRIKFKTDKFLNADIMSNFPKNLCVGISWRTDNALGSSRNLIEVENLLRQLQEHRLYACNLQYNVAPNELLRLCAAYPKFFGIENYDNFENIDALISKISVCDLIITVDNSLAHFAGLTDTPCHVLVPPKRSYLWGRQSRRKSYWYDNVTLWTIDEDNTVYDTVEKIVSQYTSCT